MSGEVKNRKVKPKTPTQLEEKDLADVKKLARIGSFPHPSAQRMSVLSDKKHQGILNLIATLLVGWCLVHMVTDYKRTGTFLDLTLAFNLLHGFPTMLIQTVFVVLTCGVLSILFEVVMLINVDIKATEESKHLQKKAYVVDVVVCTVYGITILSVMTIPIIFALQFDLSPICRGAICAQTFVFAMKLHSYFMTNRYIRKHFTSKDNIHVVKDRFAKIEKQSLYLSIRDLLQDFFLFFISPTLVYEPDFPRSERINWFEALKQYCGFVGCCLILYISIQKYVIPVMDSLESYNIAEHMFYLAVPTMLLWMIAFYAIFHCLLNALAEVSRFADREFYLEWWDATCMSEFWKLWNRAVYKWMCRHVYMESMRQVVFFNKTIAAISTYFVTAVLHEYLLAIAFVTLRPWFFGMIVAQIPFLYFTERFKGTRFGNLLMWLGFSAGLPVLELFYCYTYMKGGNAVETPLNVTVTM